MTGATTPPWTWRGRYRRTGLEGSLPSRGGSSRMDGWASRGLVPRALERRKGICCFSRMPIRFTHQNCGGQASPLISTEHIAQAPGCIVFMQPAQPVEMGLQGFSFRCRPNDKIFPAAQALPLEFNRRPAAFGYVDENALMFMGNQYRSEKFLL